MKDCRCHDIPLLVQRCQFLTLYTASALRLVVPFKRGMSLRFLKARGASRCYAVALLVVNSESVWHRKLTTLRCGVQVCRCITLVTEGFTHYCEDDEENIPRSSLVQV